MNETTHAALRELLPAYALDALDEERAEVAEHLEGCADCRRELRSLREELDSLAFSAPVALPAPGVKTALLEQVARLTQGTAVMNPADALFDRETARLPGEPTPLRARSNGVERFGRARVALPAIAAVLVLGLIGWGSQAQVRLDRERERNDQLAAQAQQFTLVNTLLNKPGAAFPVSGPTVPDYGLPAAGYVYVDPTSNVGLMLTYWLPKISADQRFQIWLVTPEGQRDSGGLFAADARGNANVIINAPAPFAKYKSVGVTVEPAAGSPGPTSPRVCGGEIR